MITGTILKGIGGLYYVYGEDGETYTLRAQSKLRHDHMSPLIGDKVDIEPGSADSDGWLKAIHPRRNCLVRPPVSNIDALVITVSASVPQADLQLVDKLLIYAKQNSLRAIIAINKSDTDKTSAQMISEQYKYSGADVYEVSAFTGEGITSLKESLKNCVHAFAGQSAVGKSSLINALYGLELDTGGLSRKTQRGKHTTRKCELIPVEGGGMVLDTPGFSLLELDCIEPVLLQKYYKEFEPYLDKCRFSPCYHSAEPDCAVTQALNEGLISKERYERYILFLSEMKERWNKRYD